MFLFLEENPIWGGTIASTLTGEFSYTYGIGLRAAVPGRASTARTPRGGGPWLPAAVAGRDRARPRLRGALGGALGGVSSSTRRAARPHAALAARGGRPRLRAWPPSGCCRCSPAGAGRRRTTIPGSRCARATCSRRSSGRSSRPRWPAWPRRWCSRRRAGGPDHRLLFLLSTRRVAARPGRRGPRPGHHRRALRAVRAARAVPGRRRPPLGLALQRLAAADLAALGLVAAGHRLRPTRTRAVLRSWIDWNYTGLQAKELWPAFRGADRAAARRTVADPRVAVEYGAGAREGGLDPDVRDAPALLRPLHAGGRLQPGQPADPLRLLPGLRAGRRRRRTRSAAASTRTFDTEAALRHLRALPRRATWWRVSPKLVASLQRAPGGDARRRACRPTRCSAWPTTGPGYVEPMAFAPVRSSPRGWRDKAYRWFTRKPLVAAAPGLHRRRAVHGRREGRVAGPARGAAAGRRAGRRRRVERRGDHDHHQPRRAIRCW